MFLEDDEFYCKFGNLFCYNYWVVALSLSIVFGMDLIRFYVVYLKF